MNIGEYIDLNHLEQHIEDGMISRRFHPKWPLAILNYTQCAMGHTHGDETLRRCRGLIYDTQTMEIVARPMEAFFNVNDERYPETDIDQIMRLRGTYGVVLEITEKMDGSMGIIYQYENNPPEVATRGSFTSSQALWATEFLQRSNYVKPKLFTPIVEIIYPGNQIVVDYGSRTALVLVALIETETGEELTQRAQEFRLPEAPLEAVKLYYKSPAQCALENDHNREGYVFKLFLPSERTPWRFKAKFKEYKLVHRAIFGMNDRDVWESLKNGGTFDFTTFYQAGPGFNAWLDGQINYFVREYRKRRSLVEYLTWLTGTEMRGYSHKQAAEFYKERAGPLLLSACFAAHDGKDYKAAIWKTLRPKKAVGYKFIPEGTE